MEKSPDAFRTISEVAEWLDIPTHVLRFWESRFAQIKPVKRAGGRRYYRPSDMRLIGGVKTLLHDQGMTIRGVQKLLREHGVKHVSSFSKSLDNDQDDASDDTVIDHAPTAPVTPSAPSPVARQTYTAEAAPAPEPEPEPEPEKSSEDDGEQPDMFTSGDDPMPIPAFVRSRPSPLAEAPAPQPAPPEPAPPSIPDTPDVPDVDPDDNAPEYADAPGLAARLAVLPHAHLAAHRPTLKAARDRLIDLRRAQS